MQFANIFLLFYEIFGLERRPTIKSGETVIIGGNAISSSSEKKNKNEHILLLLCATIVSPDGTANSLKSPSRKKPFKIIYSGKPLKIDFTKITTESVDTFEDDEFFNTETTFTDNSSKKVKSNNLKSILRSLNLRQEQVAIATIFLNIDSADLAEITGQKNQIGLPNPDLCQKILRSGKGKLMGNPKLIIKNGEEGTFRTVKEVYFPECWNPPEIGVKNNILYYTGTYPEFGTSSDVGIRLISTPRISKTGTMIYLAMNPQVVEQTRWTKYNVPLQITKVSGEKEERENLIKMPVTNRTDIISNVIVQNGSTICIGKGIKNIITYSGEKKSIVTYIFLKAKTVK
jgi:type II secretory pathway component GspD/PulD (secretin)